MKEHPEAMKEHQHPYWDTVNAHLKKIDEKYDKKK